MRPPSLEEIRAAGPRLRGFAIRTPLVRWHQSETEVWLKLETLQPINSFKIRGARNAIALAGSETLRQGVVTASAGNMAQGVAWCARALGIPCTVVVPDHAPATKLQAVERLGASIVKVPFDRWWRVLEERGYDGVGGHFVHPVADPGVIAGNGTIGLEIIEDLPEVDTVLVPFGGGGLSCGIASAVRALAPGARVIAVEPETAAPLAASFAAGRPTSIDYRATFVDGSGGRAVLPEMWPLASELLAGTAVVSIADTADAIRAMADRIRVIAEGAGALALAAVRAGKVAGRRIVCVVSGGNIDTHRLIEILEGRIPD
jgi:threonine dehydratase